MAAMNEQTFKHIFWFVVSYGESLTIELIGKQKYLDWCYEYEIGSLCRELYISNYAQPFDKAKYPILKKSAYLGIWDAAYV